MKNKKYVKIFFITSILLVFLFLIYDKIFKINKNDVSVDNLPDVKEEFQTNSNIIKDVKYVSDSKGNEYIIQR